MSWSVVVRAGSRVTKERAASLDEGLDLVEREGRALAAAPRRATVELRSRSYAPGDQVAGRVELRGPGVRAGVDVRGDGATDAWTGRVRRSLVEPDARETAYAALRRVLTGPQSTSVDP